MAFSAQKVLMGSGEPPMTLLNVWNGADNIFATDHQAMGMTFGEGLFVVCGGVGGGSPFIETSPDGITWTSRTVPHSTNIIYTNLLYADGLFVCTGNFSSPNLIILTSTDGITWTDRTLAATITLTGGRPSYANAVWFVTGGRELWRSTNGTTVWNQEHSHTFSNTRLHKIAFGDGVYSCVGGRISANLAQTMTSSDGLTWTERTIPSSTNYTPDGNIWDARNSQFLISGADGNSSSQCRIESSPTGVTFTEETTITTALRFFLNNAMDFRRSLYTMFGNTGFNLDAVVAYAAAPDSWTTYAISGSRPGIGMAFSKTRAVIIGSTSGVGNYRTWRGYQDI